MIPHSTRELPFEGSQIHQTPLQLSSQPRGPSALGARGMEGSGGGVSAASRGSRVKHPAREKAPGAAGGPPNDLISESQRGSSPLSAAGFVQPGFGHPSAHQPPVHGGGGEPPASDGAGTEGAKRGPSRSSGVISRGRATADVDFSADLPIAGSPPSPPLPQPAALAFNSLLCDPAARIILQGVNRRVKGRLCGHRFQYPSR